MILIIGATGTIGTELVTQLAEGKEKVRILTRDPKKATKFGDKVEVANGNLDDIKSLIPAMKNVERFFLLPLAHSKTKTR